MESKEMLKTTSKELTAATNSDIIYSEFFCQQCES